MAKTEPSSHKIESKAGLPKTDLPETYILQVYNFCTMQVFDSGTSISGLESWNVIPKFGMLDLEDATPPKKCIFYFQAAAKKYVCRLRCVLGSADKTCRGYVVPKPVNIFWHLGPPGQVGILEFYNT